MNLAAIDLNVLVAVDALLTEGNVTRAAARIGRSQPATSHALNRARALFRDPLLVRVGGGLQVTPRGRALAPRLRRLLAELATTIDAESSFDPARVESVTIGATDHAGFVLLPALLRRLATVAPRLALRVRPLEGREALAPVGMGIVDLALGTFPQIPAGLRGEELFRESFVCLLRRGHPDGRGRLSLPRFTRLGHLLVTSPSDGLGTVDHALAARGLTRRIAAYVPHFLVAPGIVAETDLVLTTGARIAARLAPPLRLRVLTPPVALRPFVVRMVWHPRSEDENVARWFRGVVREVAAQVA